MLSIKRGCDGLDFRLGRRNAMQRRTVLTVGAAAVAGAVAGGLPTRRQAQAGQASAYIPDVEVLDQDGRKHRFYSDLVRDRAVLINFFFTSCAETCPLVTQNLREVQDLLSDRIGRDIFMYSVSLQPELETPAILRDYAAQWDVRPGWLFLTGQPERIETLRKAIGFSSADPAYDRVKDNHIGIVRYGNDRIGRWTGTPGLGRPAWIAKALAEIADIA
jgi:protein SCO1/2